jgi:diguanylate cyclase (GGDEF)-like protein
VTAGPVELKTILVLDDDPQFHRLVVPFLTGRGHRVISAHAGREASAIIEREKVDLSIVDGQLPDVTGLDWIASVRAQGCQMLIMFVSAYWRDAASYHKLTKELGVAIVLHKPVLASVFAAEVDILLGRSAALGEGSRDDLEDTLLALRADYAGELPGRLAELSSLLSQLKTQPHNLFLAGEARSHAHKLRGTAASYGFKEIGDAAGDIEDAILTWMENAGSNYQAIADRIARVLAFAEQQAEQAASEARSRVARSPAPQSATSEPRELSAKARILVVDDDAAFLDLIDELGYQHELEIVRASNAREALEMACMHEIDAALIDVDLGSRDTTFKLAAELRNLPGYEGLPLGFLTGAGHIERQVSFEQVSDYLVFDRPTKGDALQAAVYKLAAIKQASKPTVLVIDDDREFLKRTAFVLSHEGMEVRTLEETVDVLEVMQSFSPDAVLLDVMMPGVSGFDICRMLRSLPRWRDLAILFLSAFDDVETRVACLKCGGDDYLTKPVVNEELLVRLRMRLERARLLKDRLERDNVTGLLQRRPFMEQLSALISEARRQKWTAVFALLKMSGLNDCRQHMVSDSVLSVAGNLLLKRLRAEDLKGRWNRDTLLLAFRNEPAASVDVMLQRICEEFAATQTLQHEQCDARPKLRYALACYPDDGNSIHELLQTADARLKNACGGAAAGKPT